MLRKKKGRSLGADDPAYLHELKAFLEGEKRWAEWEGWWEANRTSLQRRNLQMANRLKLLAERPDLAAEDVLSCLGIDFEHKSDYWATGPVCGETKFKAVPEETTAEEIRQFALRSPLPGWDEIAREGWLHPGAYCPHGCTWVTWNFG